MTEELLKDKARFFTQYWGQNVLRVQHSYSQPAVIVIGSDTRWNKWVNNGYLELTNLSQITDEHAIEVAKMQGWRSHLKAPFPNIEFLEQKGLIKDYAFLKGASIDFLRKNGYAMPFDKYSVEQMIELGWIKLK